jgi:hypothetical protein
VTLAPSPVRRGSTNRNERGNAAARRALKTWMLAEFGDGISTVCCFCGRVLLFSTMTKDRFPIPGRKKGRYVKGNVRPACLSCNASEGARQAAIERTEAKEKRDHRNRRHRELYAVKKWGAS